MEEGLGRVRDFGGVGRSGKVWTGLDTCCRRIFKRSYRCFLECT